MLPFTPQLSPTSEKLRTRDVRPLRAVRAHWCQPPKQVFVCLTPCDIMMVMIMPLIHLLIVLGNHKLLIA